MYHTLIILWIGILNIRVNKSIRIIEQYNYVFIFEQTKLKLLHQGSKMIYYKANKMVIPLLISQYADKTRFYTPILQVK